MGCVKYGTGYVWDGIVAFSGGYAVVAWSGREHDETVLVYDGGDGYNSLCTGLLQ